MNEFIEQKKKEFEDKFKCGCSHLGELHTDSKFSMKDFTDFLESALKESYNKGVEDAIEGIPRNWLDPLLTGDNAIIEGYSYTPTDIENLLIAIKQRLQQLKEQQ